MKFISSFVWQQTGVRGSANTVNKYYHGELKEENSCFLYFAWPQIEVRDSANTADKYYRGELK
jgi:hypothetical protein